MKILIVTQKMDRPDPILGFFHRWVEELSGRFDHMTVICLQKGQVNVPANVTLLSLGKEERQSRAQYIFRFYRYIWRERKNYDAVLVHMNQEYVLLAGVFWKIWSKKIFMWRNHKKGNFLTTISVWLSDAVFCTSPNSFTAKFSKTKIMPVGLDAAKFLKPISRPRVPNSILCMGRIGPVKRIEDFITALAMLDQEGIVFTASVAGPVDEGQEAYAESLKAAGRALIEKGILDFPGAIPNDNTPEMYGSHELYVNLTGDGSMDKTTFSAMFGGAIAVVCNTYFKDIVPKELMFEYKNPADLARALKYALALPEEKKRSIAESLKKFALTHSLDTLINKIAQEIKAYFL